MLAFRLNGWIGYVFFASSVLCAAHGRDFESPLAPEEARRHFKLAPGLEIELVVSEPVVADPVAIRFDERGRMWVVEMRDYPHGPAEGEPPRSRIVVLEDRDDDGRYEHSVVFADKLLFATGVQPWKGGVFVTMAGQVAYMKDTDGDGKCDQRETWYKGFAQQNSQLRANHPRLGIDNQIYIANGRRGGAVVDAREPQAKPVSISGMDFRFDPLTRKFEAVSGIGQFGLTFDDFGNRFVCSNRNPVKHIVLPNRYLERNPHAAISTVFQDVASAGAASHIFPISRAWTTSNLHAGQFTAACGVHVYRGAALGKAFRGNVFTCDPTGNLVHREIMMPAGPTFVSQPARKGVEFLASPDEWFRPVNHAVGPDGALYVVDMYRAVIEHPQFMPTELKNRPDLLLGNDRGRIYRIRSADAGVVQAAACQDVETVAKLKSGKLWDLLGSNNPWLRDTAARLLLERQDKGVAGQLDAKSFRTGSARARANQLWLLAGLDLLQKTHVISALSHSHPQVRRQAVILAEPWIAEGDDEVLQRVRQLANDPSGAVVFQVALSLAPANGRADESALWQIISKHLGDAWIERGVRIAAADQADSLAIRLLSKKHSAGLDEDDARGLIMELLAQSVSQGSQAERTELLKQVVATDSITGRHRLAAFLALAQSLAKRRSTIDSLVKAANDSELETAVEEVVDQANRIVGDSKGSIPSRIEAIELLGLTSQAGTLSKLAAAGNAQEIRTGAIRALSGAAGTPDIWQSLLANFAAESPAVRSAILSGALARSERTALLLDEVEAGRIKAAELDRSTAGRLLKHRDAKLRARAKTLLANAVPADRQKVLQQYQVVLNMKSDPKRGRLVFQKNCANCHRIGDLGVNVAPDISDSRTKQPAQILADVLQPNRAIDNNYVGYNVITSDGRVLSGILTSETATTITLKQPEGKSVTLLRSEIDEIRSSGVSLMPEGLEKNIPHQAMADLISFIKNWRYLDGKIPLSDGSQ